MYVAGLSQGLAIVPLQVRVCPAYSSIQYSMYCSTGVSMSGSFSVTDLTGVGDQVGDQVGVRGGC